MNKPITQEKYYTIDEVATTLKVAYLTVYRWIQARKIKAYKIGRSYRITEKELGRFIEESEVGVKV
jgi:excisionase family DNA binding protein